MSVRGHLVQTPAATVSLIDVENLSANSFKKMYTDHKMPQRKCLLMHVQSLEISLWGIYKKCTTAQIKKMFTIIPLSPLVMWYQNHFNWHVNDLVRFSQLQNAQWATSHIHKFSIKEEINGENARKTPLHGPFFMFYLLWFAGEMTQPWLNI